MLLGAAMGAGSKPQGVHVLPVTSASTLCAFLVAGACPPLENAPRIEVLAAARALHGLAFRVRTQQRPFARGAQLAVYARDLPQAQGAQLAWVRNRPPNRSARLVPRAHARPSLPSAPRRW